MRRRTTSTSIGRPDPVIIPDRYSEPALGILAAAIVLGSAAILAFILIGAVGALLERA